MAAAGAPVSETILVEASSVKSVAQRVTLAMTQDGDYTLVSTSPGRLEFERRFKPGWGMGAFSKVERCLVTVEQAPAAVVVRLEGAVLQDRLEAVRAAASGRSIAGAALDAVLGPASVTPPLEGLDEPPPQHRTTTPPPPRNPKTPSFGPQPKPEVGRNPERSDSPTPVQPMPAVRAAEPAGVAAGQQHGGGSAVLYLDLGDEGRVALDQRIVLGRDPVPPAGVSGKAVRVMGATVSKTHCWIEPAGDMALICDLYSTNGTAVADAHGRRVSVDPESPSLAARGTTVALGDCLITVVGAAVAPSSP